MFLRGAVCLCPTADSPGPAAANALSPKVLYVYVTTHVRLAVERSRRSRASATRRQSSARYDGEMPDSD